MITGRSPISFPVSVSRLPARGMPVHVVADAGQCAELAAAHDLRSIDAFEADLLVRGWKRDGVRVEGTVRARVTQNCIVTLEPMEATIESPVSALFVPEGSPLARVDHQGGEIVVDAEADDLPETFSGGRVDVGALAEEFFALALDPYPRKEGASLHREAARCRQDGEAAESRLREELGKLRPKP